MLHWVTVEILPSFLVLAFVLGCIILQNLAVGWARWQLSLMQHLALTLSLLHACVSLAWDLVLAGLSSLSSDTAADSFYTQVRTTLTYNQQLGVSDRFDWHRETRLPFAARFEDVFFFLYSFLRLLRFTVFW